MELNTYIQQVRDGVNNAAALADENTQQIAQRLGGTVESSMRLALIEALSDATSEISHELAPGSVELRMQGSTPQFVVAHGDADFDPNFADDDSDEVDVLDGELDDDVDTEQDALDDTQVRLTLRLPKWVKDKVDTYAADDGVSVNTWLAEVVMAEHAARRPRRGEHRGERRGERGGPGGFGGGNRPGGFGPIPREAAEALQFVFGPNGPLAGRGRGFGPGGPFGSQGPWGQGGPRRHQDGPDRPRRGPDADGADESHRGERRHREHDGERDGGPRRERDGERRRESDSDRPKKPESDSDRPKKHGGSHGGKKRSRAEREHHENRGTRHGEQHRGRRNRDW